MRSQDEIVQFIQERLGHIYDRPRMFGGSGEGVDTLLHYYHELLGYIWDRTEEFDAARKHVLRLNDCDAKNFAGRYLEDHADASENDIAKHVVEQWKRMDAMLGLNIGIAEMK